MPLSKEKQREYQRRYRERMKLGITQQTVISRSESVIPKHEGVIPSSTTVIPNCETVIPNSTTVIPKSKYPNVYTVQPKLPNCPDGRYRDVIERNKDKVNDYVEGFRKQKRKGLKPRVIQPEPPSDKPEYIVIGGVRYKKP